MDIETKLYVTKIFDNDLFVIRRCKISLILHKLAYLRMGTLDLSEVEMYEINYDYIQNNYDNKLRIMFPGTDSLMHEIKIEDVYEDSSKDKRMFETAGVPIKDFFRLNPKMYSFLVDDNSEHKTAKEVNKVAVITIVHNEYKDVLKTVYKIIKYKTSYLYSIGDYSVIN